MNEEDKEIKISFDPGCFDNFEGTQEELDELVKQITKQIIKGIHEGTIEPILVDDEFEDEDFDNLTDEEIFEILEKNFKDPKKLN